MRQTRCVSNWHAPACDLASYLAGMWPGFEPKLVLLKNNWQKRPTSTAPSSKESRTVHRARPSKPLRASEHRLRARGQSYYAEFSPLAAVRCLHTGIQESAFWRIKGSSGARSATKTCLTPKAIQFTSTGLSSLTPRPRYCAETSDLAMTAHAFNAQKIS
jgi:hypothetical protein